MSSTVTPEMRQMGWNVHFLDLSGQRFAPCIWRVPTPTRRYDARYLPPDKPPNDPRVAVYPIRRRAKAISPSKRNASGSSVRSRSLSPNKEEDDDALGGIVIPESAIPIDEARQGITKLRQRCMTGGVSCAISGLGKSWFSSPAIGPAIQAAHIVPQIHYHLYPPGPGRTRPDPENNHWDMCCIENMAAVTRIMATRVLASSQVISPPAQQFRDSQATGTGRPDDPGSRDPEKRLA
ncbi:hypothetical protein B0T26DRAFT_669437 [Lasiosphaeria miniovina]|uniref:HNH nuclease domain-containing protein n=1 Tax=Lasiosphaeria miniovina TaxID=1954250 RepID=A0AA40EF43_9PEZI|nr:uncharacterized protein B0T26DRAFT_669437 [Lasiosphaeria miniovina]KAK0732978.1 hypothetical protein B0T26DRAFT_669437 [Lasiosphaeria miniovina]